MQYAFFDYDGEPIYVGQTNEMVRTRIRRHLTNQRTDAVAMSGLDQFEVFTIKVWPLPEYQDVSKKKDPNGWKAAKQHLNALERAVHDKAIADSTFNAILNEKDPVAPLGVFFSAPDLAEKVYRAMHNRRATSRRRVAKRNHVGCAQRHGTT